MSSAIPSNNRPGSATGDTSAVRFANSLAQMFNQKDTSGIIGISMEGQKTAFVKSETTMPLKPGDERPHNELQGKETHQNPLFNNSEKSTYNPLFNNSEMSTYNPLFNDDERLVLGSSPNTVTLREPSQTKSPFTNAANSKDLATSKAAVVQAQSELEEALKAVESDPKSEIVTQPSTERVAQSNQKSDAEGVFVRVEDTKNLPKGAHLTMVFDSNHDKVIGYMYNSKKDISEVEKDIPKPRSNPGRPYGDTTIEGRTYINPSAETPNEVRPSILSRFLGLFRKG